MVSTSVEHDSLDDVAEDAFKAVTDADEIMVRILVTDS